MQKGFLRITWRVTSLQTCSGERSSRRACESGRQGILIPQICRVKGAGADQLAVWMQGQDACSRAEVLQGCGMRLAARGCPATSACFHMFCHTLRPKNTSEWAC